MTSGWFSPHLPIRNFCGWGTLSFCRANRKQTISNCHAPSVTILVNKHCCTCSWVFHSVCYNDTAVSLNWWDYTDSQWRMRMWGKKRIGFIIQLWEIDMTVMQTLRFHTDLYLWPCLKVVSLLHAQFTQWHCKNPARCTFRCKMHTE